MKAEKIEYSRGLLLIDGEKYGFGIFKLEILGIDEIKVYTTKNAFTGKYQSMPEDMHRVNDLMKYDNIQIIIE